jgi:hypothetical protein
MHTSHIQGSKYKQHGGWCGTVASDLLWLAATGRPFLKYLNFCPASQAYDWLSSSSEDCHIYVARYTAIP